MKHLIYIILFVLFSRHAIADKIVATVNLEPITSWELINRYKLLILLNVSDSMNVTNKQLEEFALNSLISEKALMQEGSKTNTVVTDEEIQGAIGNIEKTNNMPSGQFYKILNEQNIGQFSLNNKIKADIMRAKLVQQVMGRNLNVTMSDVASYVDDGDASILVFTTKGNYDDMLGLKKKLKTCDQTHAIKAIEVVEKHDKISNLQQEFGSLIKDLGPNQTSGILRDGDHLKMVMVCQNTAYDISKSENQELWGKIVNRKTELTSMRYQQNLLRKAHIKIFPFNIGM